MHKKSNSERCADSSNWKQMNPEQKQSMKERFMKKWSQCHFDPDEPTADADKKEDIN